MSSSISQLDRRFPSGRLEGCTAAPTPSGNGGGLRLRFCFDNPLVDASEFRVTALETPSCWQHLSYVRFTVEIGGEQRVIWLHRASFQSRFRLTPGIMWQMHASNDLMRLIFLKACLADPSCAQQIRASAGHDLHFSAKHFGLERSIYIGESGFIAYGVPKQVVGNGGFAVVKRAVIPNTAEPVVRRIERYTPGKGDGDMDNLVSILKQVSGREGILPLLGICRYVTPRGIGKLATFHPFYPTDFLRFLFSPERVALDLKIKYGLARQIFVALRSLGMTHHDFKPDNLLYNPDVQKVALCDLQTCSHETDGNRSLPLTPWSPPEYRLGFKTFHDKFDVWALGITLACLFSEEITFGISRWFTSQADLELEEIPLLQGLSDLLLEGSSLSRELKTLLRRMIRFNPRERYTLREAFSKFNESCPLGC